MGETIDLKALQSEGRNPKSIDIDVVSTLELCGIINDEDKTVANAVTECLPNIAAAIDALTNRVRAGGKVVYVGAGTSGRLGVLDASELPPTFSARPEQFVALIAGGDKALRHAQEGAEDDIDQAVQDLRDIDLNGKDALIGIAASGRTPYVLSCLRYARSIGCATVGIACSSPSAMGTVGDVDYMVEAVTGAEVVTGSTRMKAGTVTKMVLNMLSTGIQIKLGKTFGNMMVDVKATNLKLQQRARNILRELSGSQCPTSDSELDELLTECGGSVKLAIAALELQVTVAVARERLEEADGVLGELIKERTRNAHPAANGSKEVGYVLCVDGGGSKCAAFLMNTLGETWSSEVSGRNVTAVDATTATESIKKVITQVVDTCPPLKGRKLKSVPFAKVWIGLAGFDRPQVAQALRPKLRSLFDPELGGNLTVTNDLELLAAAAGGADYQDVCVLVAGTGSIAMTFRKGSQKYEKIGRAGGWGPLLGDDGSGFDIGRQAIRHVLGMQDVESLCGKTHRHTNGVDSLSDAVLQHFDLVDHDSGARDLISHVLMGPTSSTIDPKQRIAQVAKVVLQEQDSSQVASEIIGRSVKCLAGLVKQVVDSSGLKCSAAVLVMTGGMMRNPRFHSHLIDRLALAGSRFGRVDLVLQPGLSGAQYLLSTLGCIH